MEGSAFSISFFDFLPTPRFNLLEGINGVQHGAVA